MSDLLTEQQHWWRYVLDNAIERAEETGLRYRVEIQRCGGNWDAYMRRIVPYQQVPVKR